MRETLFNWLVHLVPDFHPVRGLDLFAGTGALGFELASRGAGRVTLVERQPALAAQLARTKDKLDADSVTVVPGDAFAVARGWPGGAFDVIFLDPPFDAGLLAPALAEAARLAARGGYVYVESREPLDASAVAARGLSIVRQGQAGRVLFHLLQKA